MTVQHLENRRYDWKHILRNILDTDIFSRRSQ
jgi:hypothetical protein